MIRRRLLMGIATLGLLVALASAVSLLSHEALHGRLDEVAEAEREMAGALMLSLAVRDVYAHQAHSVVLNDNSHLDHYVPALHDAKNLVIALSGLLERASDEVILTEASELLGAIDDNFWRHIVPRLGGPREALIAPHDQALALTDRLGLVIDRLTRQIRGRVDESQRVADEGRDREILLLAAVLLVALLVAFIVSRRLVMAFGPPLAALETGARRFATGDLAHRIPIQTHDELSALARQMNAMAHDLAVNGHRLLETEKLASLGKLAAGIAHEVNNPLAAISGYAQVLERSLVNLSIFEKNPELAADLDRIHSEVQRCRAIVAGLLDLARPPRLSLFPVDLLELVDDTRRALEAAGHRCELTVVTPDTPLPELEVDPSKIRQVLFNVLKNAAEAGSPIVLHIACTPEALTLTVTDSGPGLDPAIEANLFEPFRTTKANGTGLGLAVSRALARAHGGDLIALPTAPGNGASFALTLPHVASPTGVA